MPLSQPASAPLAATTAAATGETTAAPIDFNDGALAYAYKESSELRWAAWVMRAVGQRRLSRWGSKLGQAACELRLPLSQWLLKTTVFNLFCGGQDLDEAAATCARLARHGVQAILDYAVEGAKSEEGFAAAESQLIATLERGHKSPGVRYCALKMTALVDAGLLAKEQSGERLTSAERAALQRGARRLTAVATAARRCGIPLLVDAEESWIQQPIDAWTERLMRRFNKREPVVFTTVQMYLNGKLDYLQHLLTDAARHGYIVGVKVVRGAYLETENQRAAALGLPRPTQPSLAATHAAFDAATQLCLSHLDHVAVMIATHNVQSTALAIQAMAAQGLARRHARISFAQLLGMYDRITFALAHHGYNAAKYVPYGAVRLVLPYLMRRAEENSAVTAQMAGELALIKQELARRGRARA